ncbi:MAG: hypothetical protein DK304_000495 [Chloroflexi bacterium]|jgi:hypothetical protein|nr:MAG: hypothetical protein DK304_000495 [Chloroflexota bacterium]
MVFIPTNVSLCKMLSFAGTVNFAVKTDWRILNYLVTRKSSMASRAGGLGYTARRGSFKENNLFGFFQGSDSCAVFLAERPGWNGELGTAVCTLPHFSNRTLLILYQTQLALQVTPCY